MRRVDLCAVKPMPIARTTTPQPRHERRAGALGRCNCNHSPVGVYDPFDDVQAEPQARCLGFLSSAERFKDLIDLFRRNWKARAMDLHDDVLLLVSHGDTNDAVGRTVLDSVSDEIRHQLRQPITIPVTSRIVASEA